MKLIKIINARTVIDKLGNEKISIPLAYKFMKILKATEEDEKFYKDKFVEILGVCAQKDEDGKPIQTENGFALVPEKIDECKQRMTELENTEVDIKASLSIEELGELKMSMKDLFSLDGIIVE